MNFDGMTIEWGEPPIIPEGDHWRLNSEYTVRIGQSHKLVCPDGMWTDGASIPRFFWRLIGHPMQLPGFRAAIIHDGGYMGELIWYHKQGDDWIPEEYTKQDIDELFRELLKALGVSRWRYKAMYRAVRLFGKGHWKPE